MSRLEGGWRGRRFAAAVLVAVVASLALLAVLLATTTTPGQAAAQRAIPDLPPPTMRVAQGSRAGVVAVPQGAIVSDQHHHSWVNVWTDGASRRVVIHEVHSAPQARSSRSPLVEVTGPGLRAGELVVLVAEDDTDIISGPGA